MDCNIEDIAMYDIIYQIIITTPIVPFVGRPRCHIGRDS